MSLVRGLTNFESLLCALIAPIRGRATAVYFLLFLPPGGRGPFRHVPRFKTDEGALLRPGGSGRGLVRRCWEVNRSRCRESHFGRPIGEDK